MSDHRPAMKEILQKTMSVSRELDALQREHHRILTSSKIAEDALSGKKKQGIVNASSLVLVFGGMLGDQVTFDLFHPELMRCITGLEHRLEQIMSFL